MALECPTCRHPVSFWRSVRTTAWGRFPCRVCGSILGVDVKRRFASLVPFIPVSFFLLHFIGIQNYGALVFYPTMIVVFLVLLRLFERITLLEARAFRCETCGYDLRGQIVTRCPECGSEFDPGAKERVEARVGKPAPRARHLWLLVVLIVLFSATLVAGILAFRNRQAGQQPAPPPPTSAPQPAP